MNRIDEPTRGEQTIPVGPPRTPAERQEFWVNTCQEVTHMHIASQRVLELYQKHGCRFTVPSRQQVQDVLDALDSAMPNWEKEHPELFYQTLELNFPELLRRS
jgi:hypothetical protein